MKLVGTPPKPVAAAKPLADGDVVRTAIQVPVIKTKDEFFHLGRRFQEGGAVLSLGYAPTQRGVLEILMGIHMGMEASPFDFDDNGNVVEKDAQLTAEPMPTL